MLEGLVETIEILRERIRNHGEKVRKNGMPYAMARLMPCDLP